jgi:hypothetical protein
MAEEYKGMANTYDFKKAFFKWITSNESHQCIVILNNLMTTCPYTRKKFFEYISAPQRSADCELFFTWIYYLMFQLLECAQFKPF